MTSCMEVPLIRVLSWPRVLAIIGMLAVIAAALLLSQSCAKHTQPQTPRGGETPVAQVSVAQTAPLNPFLCTISPAVLQCIATVDVRFRRGQRETQVDRGYIFSFTTPQGNGKGSVWFGCASTNSCEGYFMFGSPAVTVTPTDPARYWQGGTDVLVPAGSLGIAEVTVQTNAFVSIRNRWTGAIAPPLLKPGAGTSVVCTDDICTVAVK